LRGCKTCPETARFSAGDWPHSRRVIDEIFAGVPDDERSPCSRETL
jgi:hypothetical protein